MCWLYCPLRPFCWFRMSIPVGQIDLPELVGPMHPPHQINVVHPLPAVHQPHVDPAIQGEIPHGAPRILPLYRLTGKPASLAAVGVEILQGHSVPDREPVPEPEKEVLRRPPLGIANWHTVVDVPFREGTSRIEDIMPKEVLEADIVPAVCGQPGNIDPLHV